MSRRLPGFSTLARALAFAGAGGFGAVASAAGGAAAPARSAAPGVVATGTPEGVYKKYGDD